MRLRKEIELGELLLAGRKVRFERLSQSKYLKQFAHDLYDPLGKCCVISEEVRGEVEKAVRKLKSMQVGKWESRGGAEGIRGASSVPD